MIDLRYGRCCLESLREMKSGSVHCVVTSPPYYGLRDYGVKPSVWGGDLACVHEWADASWRADRWGKHDDDKPGQKQRTNNGALGHRGKKREASTCLKCGAWLGCLGLEPTLAGYIEHLVMVFMEVWRVLRNDGTLWLNIGDSYAASGGPRNGSSDGLTGRGEPPQERLTHSGVKAKDLMGVPWTVAFALRDAGWYLRSDIVWCLSGGTQLYTRTQKGDMRMSVKEVVRLDPSTVKLWNGQKWTQVLGFSQSTDPREALEIELRSGECIGCTPGHVWPTQRGNVRTDEIRPGDVIQTTRLPEPDEPTNADALSDDIGWLCGLYLAEGSMSNQTVQIAGHVNDSEMRLSRLEFIAKRFHGTIRVHANESNAASICMTGPVIASIIRAYIYGDSAHTKGLKSRIWQRRNSFLRAVLEGYLSGDAHHDKENDRYRLGFTRNDRLADDLRTLAARLGLSMRLAKCMVKGFGRSWPAYRGDIRLAPIDHANARKDGEVVSIRPGKGRKFWDIGVEDEPHLFALASGILTHNSKPNPMPESVEDRPTRSHEHIFLLTKSARYFYDHIAIAEPSVTDDIRRPYGSEGGWLMDGRPKSKRPNGRPRGELAGAGKTRNKRSVWEIGTKPFPGAHFAVFPPALIEPCILAGTSARGCCPTCGAQWERITEKDDDAGLHDEAYGKTNDIDDEQHRHKRLHRRLRAARAAGGHHNDPFPKARTIGWEPTCECRSNDPIPSTILDPFSGSGTTCATAFHLGRNGIGLDASIEYHAIAIERCGGLFVAKQ